MGRAPAGVSFEHSRWSGIERDTSVLSEVIEEQEREAAWALAHGDLEMSIGARAAAAEVRELLALQARRELGLTAAGRRVPGGQALEGA